MITDLMENQRLDDLSEKRAEGDSRRPTAYLFGMDAVLLSGFASVKPGRIGLWIWVLGHEIIPLLLFLGKNKRRAFHRAGDPDRDHENGPRGAWP